jgi:radical SAM superfamily enzyme YgiQ (UPF0313 family)
MFDERISLERNFLTFLEVLNIIPDFGCIEKHTTNYSLEKNFRKKTAVINIGSGCKAKCRFCTIADTKLIYRPVDVLMQEITSLLNMGVKYFHVANHSFSCDRKFMKDFCTKLMDMIFSYDFAWSCFVVPSFFVDNIDLLPLMAKSNLKKIEIGCESGSEILLSEMNIKHSSSDIEKIIAAAIFENIYVFSAHFNLGSPKESVKSLTETKDLILKLLDLTTALCDIHLHCYFPETTCFESVFDEIVNKRSDFMCESELLTIEELNRYRKQIHIAIKSRKNELKSKVGLRKQYVIFMLEKKYNITSQTGRDYFSKTRNY